MFISQAFAATETHGAADAHVDTIFPPFDSSHWTSQLFWLVVLFGLLYWLMSRVALPRVTSILDDRAKRIDADLKAARAAQDQAADAQRLHEKTVADARAAAQTTAQGAREAVTSQADTRRRALESELAAKIAESDALIAQSKNAAMSNVRTIAADAAAAIVQQLTGRVPDPKAIDAALATEKA